jgi:hypothetical protein
VSGGSSAIRRGQAIYGKEDFHGVENIIELGEQRWGKNFGQRAPASRGAATLIRPVYEKFAESPPWFAQWMFPSWEKLWPALKPLVLEAVLSARRAAARRQ